MLVCVLSRDTYLRIVRLVSLYGDGLAIKSFIPASKDSYFLDYKLNAEWATTGIWYKLYYLSSYLIVLVAWNPFIIGISKSIIIKWNIQQFSCDFLLIFLLSLSTASYPFNAFI